MSKIDNTNIDEGMALAQSIVNYIIEHTDENSREGLMARITKEATEFSDRVHEIVAVALDSEGTDDLIKVRLLIAGLTASLDAFEKGGVEND